MSAADIVSHVRCFVSELLPRAESANNWSADDISSALIWARQCEHVAKAAHHSATFGDLLGELLMTLGVSADRSLSLLAEARLQLFRRLLQNSSVSFQLVVSAAADELSPAEYNQLIKLATAEKQAYQLCMNEVCVGDRNKPLRRRMEAVTLYRYLSTMVTPSGSCDNLNRMHSKVDQLIGSLRGPFLAALSLSLTGRSRCAPVDAALTLSLTRHIRLQIQKRDNLLKLFASTGWPVSLWIWGDFRRLSRSVEVCDALCDAAVCLLRSGCHDNLLDGGSHQSFLLPLFEQLVNYSRPVTKSVSNLSCELAFQSEYKSISIGSAAEFVGDSAAIFNKAKLHNTDNLKRGKRYGVGTLQALLDSTQKM